MFKNTRCIIYCLLCFVCLLLVLTGSKSSKTTKPSSQNPSALMSSTGSPEPTCQGGIPTLPGTPYVNFDKIDDYIAEHTSGYSKLAEKLVTEYITTDTRVSNEVNKKRMELQNNLKKYCNHPLYWLTKNGNKLPLAPKSEIIVYSNYHIPYYTKYTCVDATGRTYKVTVWHISELSMVDPTLYDATKYMLNISKQPIMLEFNGQKVPSSSGGGLGFDEDLYTCYYVVDDLDIFISISIEPMPNAIPTDLGLEKIADPSNTTQK